MAKSGVSSQNTRAIHDLIETGDTSSTELAQISTGQLFLVRPESIQGSRECLFNNAMITIRRSTQEFNFQLVATRVFEEGEEQLLDEDEESACC